jgi:hypothetical protein
MCDTPAQQKASSKPQRIEEQEVPAASMLVADIIRDILSSEACWMKTLIGGNWIVKRMTVEAFPRTWSGDHYQQRASSSDYYCRTARPELVMQLDEQGLVFKANIRTNGYSVVP